MPEAATETRKLPTQYSRAMFDVSSINEENRTVDVVFATEAEVRRWTWDGPIIEILVCDPSNIRMERINAGAPLLDTHARYSLENQIGVVESATVSNKECRATIRFSKREEVQKIWNDVKDKILRGISVGYNVFQYEVTERANALPIYRATDWEPCEISLVPVPADFKSGVRSDVPTHDVNISLINKNSNMPETTTTAPAAVEQRSADPVQVPAATTAPAAPVTDPAEAVRAATQAATRRVSDILHAVRSAGLDLAFGETLVNDANMTVDAARTAIIAKLAENQQPATRTANTAAVVPGADEVDKKRKGMSNAILHRVSPSLLKADEQPGEYRGMSLIDLGREALAMAGTTTRGMMPREIAMAALNLDQRMHSSSDFPLILGDTVNRTLRAAYELQQRTFQPFCRQGSAKDFREMSRTQLSDFTSLDEIKEGGEYKFGTIGEGAEKYRVVKYGKKINITWETLINDDLNAFSRLPQAMAASASQKQSDIVYGILTANAAMADGTALFHADHGNLTGTGTALSVTSLGVARAMFRKQTAPNGSKLNLIPKYLIVSPDLETLALQYTSQNYVSAKGSDINVWAGMLTPIVDARLTGNAWYLAADPSNIDTIEYSFLEGEELFTEQRNGFDVDGLEMKVRMVFGAKAIDYRGLYKNAGA